MSITPEHPAALDRRTVLRRAAAVGMLATPAIGLLGACATSGSDGDNEQVAGGTKSEKNPLGVKEDAAIEVVIFNGGYGEKYATDVHEPLYKKAFPKAEVKHQATQAVSTVLQPRFASGNPPEFVNNSGEKLMDFGALVADGQLQDLTELWDAPSVDDPTKKVRDTVVPGTIEAGSFNGKPFVLYYVSTVFGIWYSGKLFKDNGWAPAKNWDEFIALLTNIKAKGITPYGYAGANAAYYQWNVILTHAAKIGGTDVLKNIDNLEDGAWKQDAVKQAAAAWAEVGAKFSDKSFEGLKHTDVQLRQNQYKVAMYPSGDWLEGEQKKDTPAGFDYQLMPVPSLSASDKLPATALRATAGEGYFVSAKSKNPKGGLEYMRQMLSTAGAKGFTEVVKAPTVVTAGSEGFAFPPGVASSQAALKAAGQDVFNLYFDGWYKELDTEARTATNELMFGRINADAFVERIQKRADAIKKDSSVTKFKR
ncbi:MULTISPECIES: N-acetylglucosamine/diacetylchitobiose ABC transporter substrate-binding protein [Micromonospora]|uniref:N-acetylglucosamine/diacetylchitobiose ABC transporter substrate-binding protein n=1 Tax=Micromonospora TaxID=1873 RepID=UPI001EE9749C|nr:MULTISPECIES: N-acetylglucosamine/diacetylchitobiose ABC transporter substrate-binding protein [Micromonospora]MCG5452832.1 N-acetylglucosamine/diacetylchitobiose ABC transporter substrate-binding protein [Micromonospora hortensis]MCX5121646.1 N-acetylglucosamine/diacetylchitobiose ABC transporter substrate-binding protein [Micromonospora sp. NBC_00362]WTI06407.1 N-acetylglucosamine/diacetylchitobiose ABC transporter substrate-binding protein [Micromonospora sp. NBC_00821]